MKRPLIAWSSPASSSEWSRSKRARWSPPARRSRRASRARPRPRRPTGQSGGSSGRSAARHPRARRGRGALTVTAAAPRTRERDARSIDLQRRLGQVGAAARVQPRAHPARRADGVIKSELNVSDGQPQVFIVGKAPNQRKVSPFAAARQCATAAQAWIGSAVIAPTWT